MYTPTIGLEIHAELKTRTKMFCCSKNEPHAAEPNTHICPICMGHPGTLPVVNKQAIEHVILVGLAVEGKIASYTEFDRKNYFYPDIPKGYQLSQYLYPLVSGGSLKDVTLTRIHIEEDTARSQHTDDGGTLIDYNRAGVPLMELVTEPVIKSAKEASDFARELQLLLQVLGVSDAQMEKGEMRVEANISVSKTEQFGTKVEIKNLNSFRSLELAIAYEIKRQTELYEKGEQVVQETRGWDDVKLVTISQRVKETANDYRYFPDPDIPKFNLSIGDTFNISRLNELMPILPQKYRLKYENLGLTSEYIELIISSHTFRNFYEALLKNAQQMSPILAQSLANFLLTDTVPYIAKEMSILDRVNPLHFLNLVQLFLDGKITSRVAKDLLPRVLLDAEDPLLIVKNEGLLIDDSVVESFVLTVISAHPDVVAEYQSGKTAALQFLIGNVMKLSRGSSNPAILKKLFDKNLSK